MFMLCSVYVIYETETIIMDKTTFIKDFTTLGLLMIAGYFWLGFVY